MNRTTIFALSVFALAGSVANAQQSSVLIKRSTVPVNRTLSGFFMTPDGNCYRETRRLDGLLYTCPEVCERPARNASAITCTPNDGRLVKTPPTARGFRVLESGDILLF